MTESFPTSLTLGEGVPRDQIEAFEKYGRRLFKDAGQRFGFGRAGVGRTDASILDRVRYETRGRDLVTIADSAAAIKAEETVSSTVAVVIETSLPWTLDFPNAYVRETFIFPGFGESEVFEYSLGVNEYTLEGEHMPQGHTLEDVRNAYPGDMKPFHPECTPEHFTDQLLTLAQLQPSDEVGCEPNPYSQIYRG